jgi:hypothetical protein
MRKRAVLNIVYTIGMVVAFVIGYQEGFEKKQYPILVGALIILGTFIVLKIKLYKEIKELTKKP